MFNVYKIPTYVIFDNDEEDDKDKKKREDILKTLGEEAIEGVLKEEDTLIKDKYSVFGKDFETSLRSIFPNYLDLEEEAKDIIEAGAKPFIARYVAEKLVEQKNNETEWEEFKTLKERIQNLSEPLGLDELNEEGDGDELHEDIENIPF